MRRRTYLRGALTAGGLAVAGCSAIDSPGSDLDVDDGFAGAGGDAPGTSDTGRGSTPGPPRDLDVPPIVDGPHAVGTTNIELDDAGVSAGRGLGDHQRGFVDGDTRRYVDQVLAHPDDVFSFDLAVPDDAPRYGSDAGSTLPVVGFVLYPTADANDRPDYTLGPATLPRMQGPGEGPDLGDPSGPYPLLVYSHGRAASPMNPVTIEPARRLASQGYVVCVLFHGDRRFEPLSADTLDEPQEFTLRPLAVSRAIDELLAGTGGFADVLDSGRVGGVGRSYGGATMAAVTGAEVLPFGMVTTETDRRVRATVGWVSFMGAGFFGLRNRGASSVFAPHMTIAGSADELTDLGTYEAVVSAIPEERYLVVVEGQGHEFAHETWSDVETWAYYFLETHVRGEPAAARTLATMRAVTGGGDDRVAVP